MRASLRRTIVLIPWIAVIGLCLTASAAIKAQRGRGGAAPTPRAASPIDLTGYWVSVVSEDWRYRMVTPPKGDFASVPLNDEGRKVVDAWDPAKPQVKQFVAGYTKEMGQEPYSMHGYGYDGVMLAVDAIRRAGSTDKEKVRQAMQATRGYRGVLGSIPAAYTFEEGKRTGFDPQGMVVRMYEGDKQGRVLHVGTK